MEERHLAGLAGVLDGGPDGRAPLVLLHGLTFDRAMWQPALDALGRIDPGRQVLALDLPGHGGSPAWPRYDIDSIAAAVQEAVTTARLHDPVVVGHSMAAVIATVYAARYPAHGVVNVDQPLQVAPVPQARQAACRPDPRRGFAAAWQVFEDSMHMELLPPQARRLLRPVSHVRQDVVAGYWREAIDRPAQELATDIKAALAKIRAAGTGYLFTTGHEAGPAYRRWLSQVLPQATIQIWPGSGHFPHLAHPERFAACLAATAQRGEGA